MSWLLDNLELIGSLTVQHLRLSAIPIIVGLVVAIPLGWVAYRFQLTRGLLLTLVGLLYTIPSLALFVILPPIIGTPLLSELNVIIALSIYAVAIMSRSIADALASVDTDVKQAATAVGYSTWHRFWSVDFPLAGPVVLAGLRVVAVSTVSLLTVGAAIGIDTLGYLFTNGYQRGIVVSVLTGVIATVVIALLVDRLLVLLGRALMPWTRVGEPRADRSAESKQGVERRSLAFGRGTQQGGLP